MNHLVDVRFLTYHRYGFKVRPRTHWNWQSTVKKDWRPCGPRVEKFAYLFFSRFCNIVCYL